MNQQDDRFRRAEMLFDRSLVPPSDHPSLIFFTAHKAASAYVAHLLSRIADEQSIVPLDLHGFALEKLNATSHRSEVEFYMQCMRGGDEFPAIVDHAKPREIFLPKGCYYGAVRSPDLYSILPHRDEFKILVQLRDPRDALTSWYFSLRYSHPAPGDPALRVSFDQRRQEIAEMGIDEFVLKQVPKWLGKYDLYCKTLLDKPNVLLVKYEEMVEDFARWLDRILAFWGIAVSDHLQQVLVREADFQVQQEDVYSHKRQVTPGDHLRKLKPATIAELTKCFRSPLERLGYLPSTIRENKNLKLAG